MNKIDVELESSIEIIIKNNDIADEIKGWCWGALFSKINRYRLGVLLLVLFSPFASAAVLEFDGATDIIDEGRGAYTFTVTRSAAGGASSVAYTISGSATAGSDYSGATSGVLNWGVSDGADKTFTINITDDLLVESDETIVATLSSPTGGDTLGTINPIVVTVQDNDAALEFNVSTVSIGEGSGAYTFIVTRSAARGPSSVGYSISGSATAGSDYTGATTGILNWGNLDGADKTFSINIIDDLLVEPNETIIVTLNNPTGGDTLGSKNSIVVTLGDDDIVENEIDDQSPNLSDVANLSSNQQGTARVIDTECSVLDNHPPTNSTEKDFKTLCDNLKDAGTSAAEVKAALDAINPEELTKMGFLSRQIGSLQHQNIDRRLGVIHRGGGGGGIDLSGLNLNIEGQEIPGTALASMLESYLGGGAGDEFSRWSVFANGNLKFGDEESSDTNGGYDFDMFALTIGIDYRFTDDLVLGASIGYGAADIDYSHDAGGMDTTSWSGTVYASYYLNENWYVDALMNYAEDDYDSKRRILYTDARGTVDRTATGSSDGDQLSFSLSSGYIYQVGAWVFGPHFSTRYFDVNVGKLRETGAEAWNAIVSSNDSQSFTASGGARASYTFTRSWGIISPYARFDLVHEFYDDPETLQTRFAVSSDLIKISSDRADRNYANLGLGVTAQFDHGLSGFVDYQTAAGYSGFNIHDVSVGMSLERSF